MVGEAVIQSLRYAWGELHRLGVPAALAGGLALSMWKYVRATRDIDMLVDVGEDKLQQILSELRLVGIRTKLEPPAVSLGPFKVVPLVYEPPETYLDMEIDLLLANTEYQREALGRRVTMPIPGLEFPLAVLACEDLVLHKLLAGRLIDRVDTTELLRVNVASLDMQYLVGWIERLKLRREFAEVWTSIFPGQDVPGPAH